MADLKLASEYAGMVRSALDGQVVKIMIFGSRARGDAVEGSDFDIVVVVKKRTPTVREAVLDAGVKMMNLHGALFSAIIYDEEEWEREQNFPLAWNVREEGVTA